MLLNGRLSQCGFKYRIAISPQIFGVVERKVRHLQEIVGVDSVLRRERYTDAGADADNLAIDGERLGNQIDNAAASVWALSPLVTSLT